MSTPPSSRSPLRIVVMGVSGSGKSTVGAGLAIRLGTAFADADALHPAANVTKMRAGIPLDDTDRAPWLDLVAATLRSAEGGLVVACSALRRTYRDRIRRGAPDAVFLELDAERALLAERLGARVGHFMPASLLDSQLATLEPLAADEPGARIRIRLDDGPDRVLDRALAALAAVG